MKLNLRKERGRGRAKSKKKRLDMYSWVRGDNLPTLSTGTSGSGHLVADGGLSDHITGITGLCNMDVHSRAFI